MNKERITKAIEELEYAIELNNDYHYWEAITNHALPILKYYLFAENAAKTNDELLKSLEKLEKPKMTLGEILNNIVKEK